MFKAYLFDLDGTIYRGATVIPEAPEVVTELRRRGALVRFLTNNSSQTRAFFVEKLNAMGFDTNLDEVLGSAYGTARYCRKQNLATVFVVGEAGLAESLRSEGVEVVNMDPDGKPVPQAIETAPDAVVVGICRHFDYSFMNAAMQRIRQGARFVATNTDATFPLENDVVVPGAGSIVAAIATASGEEPFVVGKPNPYMVRLVLDGAGLNPEQAVVVGDRYETDILCGKAAGCPTFMVLTGVSERAPEGQWSGLTLSDLL